MSALLTSLRTVVGVAPCLFLGLVILYIGKNVLEWTTPRIHDDCALSERENPAFGIRFVGVVLGIALPITGRFYAFSTSFVANLIGVATAGMAGIGKGGHFAAIGIILKVSISGTTSHLSLDLLATRAVAVAGLIILILARFITDLVLLPGALLANGVGRRENIAAGSLPATGFVAAAILVAWIAARQFLQ